MAAAVGCGSASGSWGLFDSSPKKRFRVSCVSSSAVRDPYKTLKIKRGASESEVKKAFRSLALKYHPDVCKGRDCGDQFHQIYEAYDIVMSKIREETVEMEDYEVLREPTMMDRYWDDQEEYRGGWEGAWIPSYGFPSYGSHV